jgi:hypothetical protein
MNPISATEVINTRRRNLFGAAAITFAAAELGLVGNSVR